MSELINYINSNCKSSWSGRAWLDIEGSQYWSSSTTTNKNFYQVLYEWINEWVILQAVVYFLFTTL